MLIWKVSRVFIRHTIIIAFHFKNHKRMINAPRCCQYNDTGG